MATQPWWTPELQFAYRLSLAQWETEVVAHGGDEMQACESRKDRFRAQAEVARLQEITTFIYLRREQSLRQRRRRHRWNEPQAAAQLRAAKSRWYHWRGRLDDKLHGITWADVARDMMPPALPKLEPEEPLDVVLPDLPKLEPVCPLVPRRMRTKYVNHPEPEPVFDHTCACGQPATRFTADRWNVKVGHAAGFDVKVWVCSVCFSAKEKPRLGTRLA